MQSKLFQTEFTTDNKKAIHPKNETSNGEGDMVIEMEYVRTNPMCLGRDMWVGLVYRQKSSLEIQLLHPTILQMVDCSVHQLLGSRSHDNILESTGNDRTLVGMVGVFAGLIGDCRNEGSETLNGLIQAKGILVKSLAGRSNGDLTPIHMMKMIWLYPWPAYCVGKC